MSRRDTIIIAVLINVALLTVLFTTAINTSDEAEEGENVKGYVAMATSNPPPIRLASHSLNLSGDSPKVQRRIPSLPASTPAPISHASSSERIVPQVTSTPARSSNDAEGARRSTQPLMARSESKPHDSNSPASVVVKKGDVLSRIAVTHGTTVDALMQENGLTSTTLRIGQVLKIPGNKARMFTYSSASAEPAKALATTGPEYYQVQKGDSPWKIARDHGVSLSEFLKLNDLNEDRARRIRPGDRLRVR